MDVSSHPIWYCNLASPFSQYFWFPLSCCIFFFLLPHRTLHALLAVVQSLSLQPRRLQHARSPCPSLSPRVYRSSCPLSRKCHPTISSSATLFFPSIRVFSNQLAVSYHHIKKIIYCQPHCPRKSSYMRTIVFVLLFDISEAFVP